MLKRLLTVLIIVILLALGTALTGTAAPQSLHISVVTDATQAHAGDTLTFTYQLVNSASTPRDVILYAEIPAGTEFITGTGATPITYTLNLWRAAGTGIVPSDVKAILRNEVFTGVRFITLTVGVLDRPGSIVAKAALIDNETHVTEMTAQAEVFRIYRQTFLPLIFNSSTSSDPPSPTPVPTPLPTVTPPSTGDVLTVTKIVALQSDTDDFDNPDAYEDALAGNNVNQYPGYTELGTWCDAHIASMNQTYYPSIVDGEGRYYIVRSALVFDTRAYTTIQTATLTVNITRAQSQSPQDFGLVVEPAPILSSVPCGTGEDGLLITDSTKSVWSSVTPGISAVIDAQATSYPVTFTVSLPPVLLTPGGYSYLRFRLHREGTPPPTYTGVYDDRYADIIELTRQAYLTVNGH